MNKNILKRIIPKVFLNLFTRIRIGEQKWKQLNLYQGNAVVCPICNSEFREFGQFGFSNRKNARCHKCGSLERHRLVWLYIIKRTNLLTSKRKLRLLHIAPEKFSYEIFSTLENIEYYPCDLVPEQYSFDDILKVDLTNICFEDEYFDVILCNNVLSAIYDDSQALSELYRVLKKGAWAILRDTIDLSRDTTYEDFSIIDPKEREIAYGYKGAVRLYGRDFKNRLENSGFLVTLDDFSKSFSDDEVYRYGIPKSETIYFCSK